MNFKLFIKIVDKKMKDKDKKESKKKPYYIEGEKDLKDKLGEEFYLITE